jgi:hypothetical protein
MILVFTSRLYLCQSAARSRDARQHPGKMFINLPVRDLDRSMNMMRQVMTD